MRGRVAASATRIGAARFSRSVGRQSSGGPVDTAAVAVTVTVMGRRAGEGTKVMRVPLGLVPRVAELVAEWRSGGQHLPPAALPQTSAELRQPAEAVLTPKQKACYVCGQVGGHRINCLFWRA